MRIAGRIEDALRVLVKHFKPVSTPTDTEKDAIRRLATMHNGTADVKERHGVKAPRRP
jgi:hypothetical protein